MFIYYCVLSLNCKKELRRQPFKAGLGGRSGESSPEFRTAGVVIGISFVASPRLTLARASSVSATRRWTNWRKPWSWNVFIA